ncbi:hypothetical protein [Candidatus Protochlamydia phocaeensis]|uniref:hypothetical protein n=1 Tax=Candidatus Protochlamydia phocaeensis TaxID=1414722 RepID=UPI0008393FBD|nr:hypothetical protein [Candidatus Protochlamydia phocaeensis]
MGLISSINSMVDQSTNVAFQIASKTISNPSAGKKALQLASKGIALLDYAYNKTHCPELVRSMKGGIELIEFYGLFKTVVYWINPLTKANIDEKRLRASLNAALKTHLSTVTEDRRQTIATNVFNDVLKGSENYLNESDVRKAFQKSLRNHWCTAGQAEQIANQLKVTQKPRPTLQVLSAVCFTITDTAGAIMTLKKWGVISESMLAEAGKIAAQIGGQTRVFAFVAQFGVEQVLGVVVCAGQVFSLGDAAYRLVQAQLDINRGGTEDALKKARLVRTRAIWDLVTTGLDLTATAVPLLVVVNPPVVIGLSLVAKGTGLVAIFLKP